MASSACFASGECVSPAIGKAGSRSTEDVPAADASSSAAVPRWADLVDDVPEAQAQLAQPQQGICNGNTSATPDADSDCSTSAPSECGMETFRERWPDVASDEEMPGPQQGPGPAVYAARAQKKAPRWRPKPKVASAPRASGSSSSAASNRQPTGCLASRQRQAQSSWDSWKERPAWSSSSSWARKSNSAWTTGRSDGDSKLRAGHRAEGKQQCQFTIGIEEEPTFHVVRKVLGLHGQHVKRIAQESGAKLRLRGRGSGFKEGDEQEESTDPLMLCVSAPDARSYKIAVELVRQHLEDVYEQYREVCEDKAAGLSVNIHEGPREGSW